MLLGPYYGPRGQEFAQGKVRKYPPDEFVNDDWDIWCCSPGTYGVIPRITRFFEVHRFEPGQPWFSPEYCQFLRDFRGPVYVGGNVPDLPNAVLYPTEQVEAEFSPYFLTSSLALMMAVAILEIEQVRRERALMTGSKENDDTIGMWGVDMSAGEEWAEQRPGCQFFILEALRRGIRVYIPPESDILRPLPIYGVSEWDAKYIKATARAREMNTRIANHAQVAAENTKQHTYLQGAMDNMNYFIKTFLSDHGLPPGIFLKHTEGSGLGAGRNLTISTIEQRKKEAPPAEPIPAAPAVVRMEATEYAGRVESARQNNIAAAIAAGKERTWNPPKAKKKR
jgi:hypothetical protein